jgi:thiaminase/transcriptional activator TenA
MNNPRRIKLTTSFIKENNLSTDPPPADSLFWAMWNACTDVAQQALGTNFIQGIKAGTLDPIKYGAFNILDSHYCFNAAPDYLTAASKTQEPILIAFLQKKYQSYETYNQSFSDIWHIKSADSVIPNTVIQQYSGFESDVVNSADPLYCIPLMLPCDFLWYWLANQLMPPTAGNLYADWITSNDYPDGSYAMGNFLDQYEQAHPGEIDNASAMGIYRQAMTYEFQNFQAAA